MTPPLVNFADNLMGGLVTALAFLFGPDGRRVHPRARPFPGRALVRREGQGLLDRLRPGDLRLLRPHGTRWRFAWIPLGGYVKFLDDENSASVPSQETLEGMTPEERAGAFQTKPLWRRGRPSSPPGRSPTSCWRSSFSRDFHDGVRHARDGAAGRRAGARRGPAARAGFKAGDVIRQHRRPAYRDLRRHAAHRQRQRRP